MEARGIMNDWAGIQTFAFSFQNLYKTDLYKLS